MDRGDIAFLNFRRGVRVARRQWVSTLPDPYFIAAKFFIYKRIVMKDATSLPFHSVHSVQRETNISTHGQFHHSRWRVDALRGILPLQLRHQLSHRPQPVPYRWKRVLDLFAPDQQEYPVVRDICFCSYVQIVGLIWLLQRDQRNLPDRCSAVIRHWRRRCPF